MAKLKRAAGVLPSAAPPLVNPATTLIQSQPDRGANRNLEQ